MSNFLSYGQAKGLAYQHDWQGSIEGLYQKEAYASQERAESQQKAQHYAALLKKPENIRSEYNNKRLNSFYSEQIKKIGNFTANNPNFDSDIGLTAQFNELTSGIIDNDIVREELEVQKEFELLKQNRDRLTKEKYELEMARYDAYFSQDPNAPEEERADPYFFNHHLIVDTSKIIDHTAGSIAKRIQDLRVKGMMTTGERFDPNSFREVVTNAYHMGENKQAIDSEFDKLPDEMQKMYGTSFKWFENQVRAREDQRYDAKMLKDNLEASASPYGSVSNAWRDIFSHLANDKKNVFLGGHGNIFTHYGQTGNTLGKETLNTIGIYTGALGEDDKTLQLEDFDAPVSFKAISGEGQMRIINGQKFVSVRVSTSLTQSEAAKVGTRGSTQVDAATGKAITSENKRIGDLLKSKGFEEQKQITEGGFNYNPNDRVTSNITYEGTIWMPAVVNDLSIDQYNSETNVLGVKGMERIDPADKNRIIAIDKYQQYISQDPKHKKFLENTIGNKVVVIDDNIGIIAEYEDGTFEKAFENEDGKLMIYPATREEYYE